MNKLDAIRIYVRVAELASFTQAADSLGMPKASISTAIKHLENAVGARLLHRTTRKVQMTLDGLAFYERSKDLLADMDELESMFQQSASSISGRLRVDMPSGVAQNIVVPALPAFLNAHTGLALELSSTDRRVDLVREGFDCVLRVGTLHDSTLVARPLGRFRMVNCASPDYLARHGTPQNLDDLTQHRLIHYVPNLGSKASGWEYLQDDKLCYQSMPGSLTVNNAAAYEAACLAGLGLIQVPESGVRGLLTMGHLVEVMPQYQAEPMPVSLLYPHRRQLSRRTQVFMTWIAQVMAPHLAP